MTSGRWQRAKELLDRVLDLPVQDRDRFLDAECSEDPSLADEVRQLLAATERSEDHLETPVFTDAGSARSEADDLEGLSGSVVGSYRLTDLLGAGGMGVVYRAERIGEVGGEVAVKLIKFGMDSAQVAARFQQERRILARLTHPNIAHFIDGGVTPSGRPYFVMELVSGEPITDFCAQHSLSVEARVRVFLQVLDAIAFAHRHLIVHRDVKPSNILVGEEGRVKLLDFGVAKLLSNDESTDATLTRVGGRILTPSYSSPEQIRGEPVTTAADIYSLGVILYESLTGQKPFELDTAHLAEVQRVVSFDEPTRPSEAVTGDRTVGVPSRLLSRKISGDLDAIVLKALRKAPDRRYASAQEMKEDLQRFLDREPVLARRGTLWYRTGKFLSRHRTASVAGAVLGIATLVGGVTVAGQRSEVARQRAMAEQRVADVRQMINSLVFEVHDEVAALPGSTGARKLILDRAYEGLEALEAELPDEPHLLMQLAETYRRLGDVLGRPMGPNLGDLGGARRAFEQGIELAERAIAAAPGDVALTRNLGLLHERYASVLAFTGEVEEGFEQSEKALAIYEVIADSFPEDPWHQLTAAIGLINRSDYAGHPFFPNVGQPEQAETGYREVQRALEQPPLADDQSPRVRRYRGLVQERLARMLREKGDLEGALAGFRASLAVRERMYAESPTQDDVHRDVGVANQNVCNVLSMMGNHDEAEVACQKAFDVYNERAQADSLNSQNLLDLAEMHRSWEEFHQREGDVDRALAHMDMVVEWSDRVLARDSTSLPGRQNKLDALVTRGLIQAERGAPVVGLSDVETLATGLRVEGLLSDFEASRVDSLLVRSGRRPL